MQVCRMLTDIHLTNQEVLDFNEIIEGLVSGKDTISKEEVKYMSPMLLLMEHVKKILNALPQHRGWYANNAWLKASSN